MCILSTLSALNSIENYYYHIEFKMDSMYIGTQAMNLEGLALRSRVSLANQIIQRNQWNLIPKRMIQSRFFYFFFISESKPSLQLDHCTIRFQNEWLLWTGSF